MGAVSDDGIWESRGICRTRFGAMGAELTVVHYQLEWALGGGSWKSFIYDIIKLIY